jgi:hypothetical protein
MHYPVELGDPQSLRTHIPLNKNLSEGDRKLLMEYNLPIRSPRAGHGTSPLPVPKHRPLKDPQSRSGSRPQLFRRNQYIGLKVAT